jgi:lipoprotein-anchoring transpeptidase ErfK/SrfK
MNARLRAGRILALLLVGAASLAMLPAAALAAGTPPSPTVVSPKPSALVARTFTITGRVAPTVTGVIVTGATAGTVTLLPADSAGATFTVEVSVPYGRSDVGLAASDGGVTSEPATLTVWALGVVRVTPRLVLVDKSDYMLYVIRSGAVVASYPVAIGMRGTPTPVGTFCLDRPSRSPNGVWGPFRMRLCRKAWVRVAYRVRVGGHLVTRYHKVLKPVGTSYYIHGTNDPESIGTPASHGCVRLHNSDLRLFRGLTIKHQMTIIRP